MELVAAQAASVVAIVHVPAAEEVVLAVVPEVVVCVPDIVRSGVLVAEEHVVAAVPDVLAVVLDVPVAAADVMDVPDVVLDVPVDVPDVMDVLAVVLAAPVDAAADVAVVRAAGQDVLVLALAAVPVALDAPGVVPHVREIVQVGVTMDAPVVQ